MMSDPTAPSSEIRITADNDTPRLISKAMTKAALAPPASQLPSVAIWNRKGQGDCLDGV